MSLFLKNYRITNQEDEVKLQKELINVSLQIIFPQIIDNNKQDSHINSIIDFMSLTSCNYKKKDIYLNLKRERSGSRSISLMKNDLYSGFAGATFLQVCNLISDPKNDNEIKLENLYKTNLSIDSNSSFGCFDSIGSILYIEYLILKNTSGMIEPSIFFKHLFEIITIIKNQDAPESDIISGISGVIIVCCRMHALSPSKNTEYAIRFLTKKLLSQMTKKSENTITWGRGWPGFSHGNSGVTYALALANNVLNDHHIDSIIIKSLRYEETFKIESGWNGVDAYDTNLDFNSWCHGAIGIYMSRKAMLNEMKCKNSEIKDILLSDVQHYQETQQNREINSHESLCHGIYGNAIIDPDRYGTHFEVDISKYNPSEEKSLMLSSVGAIYTNLFFQHREKNIPNLLILE
ncbi:lantibiotic modifying enzyme [Providencia alcalifaciens]|nr:lantibiotic modifying enzyme [Providencia alcalifaciens]